MTSEPTPTRCRSRVAVPGTLMALLAIALAGCTNMPTPYSLASKDVAVPAGPGRVVETAWVVRGQSPDPVPQPPQPGLGPVEAPPSMPPAVTIEPIPAEASGPIVLPTFPGAPEKLSPGGAPGTVGCATCGGIGQLPTGDGRGFRSCSSCGGSGCVPGRKPCYPYQSDTFFGRFFGELYTSICCPDPCYEPGWVAAANAAFFSDSPRPRTIQRFRNDYAWDLQYPDRNEFFWAREQIQKINPSTGQITNIAGGTGPGRPSHFPKNKPFLGQPSVNYDQFSFYNEIATGTRASLFIEVPYRTSSPRYGDYHAGFSDINVGTKGVILDTEILLLTIQFRTYIPTGNASFGLGTGHVSLEPSLLGSFKISPDSYLQGQISEWIPIGGDPNYQGAILHYHGSYNRVLCRFAPDSPLIATFEGYGYSFQDGAYTNPAVGPYVNSSGVTYFNIGPGLRASISNAIDLGGAVSFPVSSNHFEDPLLRFELRILY